MEQDQEQINMLAKQYGFLFLQDCPKAMQIGIDIQYWQIRSTFKGVKVISSRQPDNQDVVMRKWNDHEFQILDQQVDQVIQQQQEKEENKDDELNTNEDYDDIDQTIEKLENMPQNQGKELINQVRCFLLNMDFYLFSSSKKVYPSSINIKTDKKFDDINNDDLPFVSDESEGFISF
ncbi:UNKNOWN [Stylonychia lemnae]|uniref:AAR2 N-terminal domain-containing protein n=1 Tax=Stylonychia lemnae TaxID=5949 RepID=A0A077ZRG2_STYLE|nr:UNKNOWN [Stylonychia lemnae]|eukprot:CDW72482.1 UNKNOWN [Stylonychia lemnae]